MNETYSYSGKRVSVEEGCPSILDIAVSLNRIARYAGNCQSFWTVGQHVLVVSDLLPSHLKLHGLLHDAAESMTSDIPTPFKTAEQRDLEHRLLRRLYSDLGLTFPMEWELNCVKDADRKAFAGEVFVIAPFSLRNSGVERCLQAEELVRRYMIEFADPLEQIRENGKAVQEFLRRFQMYRAAASPRKD